MYPILSISKSKNSKKEIFTLKNLVSKKTPLFLITLNTSLKEENTILELNYTINSDKIFISPPIPKLLSNLMNNISKLTKLTENKTDTEDNL